MRKLFQCRLLGSSTHPVVTLYAPSHGNLQVDHQVFHLRLGRRWEVARHIVLPDQFAQRRIDQHHRTAPAWTQLGHTGDATGVNKAAVNHGLVEIGRCLVCHMKGLPELERLQWCTRIERSDGANGRILPADHALLRGDVGRFKKGRPLDAGCKTGQLRAAHRVVDFCDIATVGNFPAFFRQSLSRRP